MSGQDDLSWALQRIAQLSGVQVDSVALSEAIPVLCQSSSDSSKVGWQQFSDVMRDLGFQQPTLVTSPAHESLPLLAWTPARRWGVVVSRAANDEWILETQEANGAVQSRLPQVDDLSLIGFSQAKADSPTRPASALRDILGVLGKHSGAIFESAAASALINVVALATSFYSMQVYDRVIPTKGEETLIVLSVGVMLAIMFDLVLKIARSRVMEGVVHGVDADLSRAVFHKLLSVRLNKLPRSVGTLMSQLKGYETVRAFLSAGSVYFMVDLPFGILFAVVISMLAGWSVAAVPLLLLLFSGVLTLALKRRMDRVAAEASAAGHAKAGLLVETVDGIEAVKALGARWRMSGRWNAAVARSLQADMRMREINEWLTLCANVCQQAGYAAIVAIGAYLALQGKISMGAVIACSIISGRALAPVAALPGILMQLSHAKAALDGLQKIWELEQEADGQVRALAPELIRGAMALEGVQFTYPGTRLVLSIARLSFKPGERVGIIGPVGAGKSSLLRMLAGLYQPQAGRILLDGMDIEHISRAVLSEQIGYLQQETKLFSGTLRDNLVIGIADPGDSAILDATRKSGLHALIEAHPKGLGLPIFEGGMGLSGGQRQLVGLTRLLLAKPKVWLMDEPTASMDEGLEARCVGALKEAVPADSLLVLVTHKSSMLALVDRLIVVDRQTVMLDGPKAEVLKHLSHAALQRAPQPAAQPRVVGL